MDSPRWEAACRAPLVAEVAARLRSPEALLLWVPQHNVLALALAGLAESAIGSAPAEYRASLRTLATRLREDAGFATEWAVRQGGGDPAPPTPGTSALVHKIARVSDSALYPVQAAAVWQWFEARHLGWTSEVMLRRPASDLRRRFASDFDWEVVRPFRRAIDRALVNMDDAAWAETQHVFDELTNLLADWQAERLALAGPGRPPGPLRPGQEALHLAKPAIAAIERLLSVKWDFGRPLQDQVPDLPGGTTGVPEASYVMVVLGGAFYTPADAEAEGQPPLDELLAAIAAGVEATAGPPVHHPRWGDLSLSDAPFEHGSDAAVWATPSARIALTSLQYDHHQPALVQAFVVPPGSFARRLAFQLWRTQRWMRVHR